MPHGTVHIETIFAQALGQAVKCYVYTPPGYDTSTKKFPVLYLLHGGSGDPSNWTASGSTDLIADNFIASGKMKPMVIVMPHAEFPREQPYTETARIKWLDTFEQHLLGEVLPFAEKHYRKRPIDLLRQWHTKIEEFILQEAGVVWLSVDENKKIAGI